MCTNMRPRLTHIWAETGTENGSLLKEKGMTSCAEPYDAVKGLRKELSCKQCLQKSANILTARLQAQTRIVTGGRRNLIAFSAKGSGKQKGHK